MPEATATQTTQGTNGHSAQTSKGSQFGSQTTQLQPSRMEQARKILVSTRGRQWSPQELAQAAQLQVSEISRRGLSRFTGYDQETIDSMFASLSAKCITESRVIDEGAYGVIVSVNPMYLPTVPAIALAQHAETAKEIAWTDTAHVKSTDKTLKPTDFFVFDFNVHPAALGADDGTTQDALNESYSSRTPTLTVQQGSALVIANQLVAGIDPVTQFGQTTSEMPSIVCGGSYTGTTQTVPTFSPTGQFGSIEIDKELSSDFVVPAIGTPHGSY